MKRVRIKIFGKVQGVGFRFFIYKNAKNLGLRGWVRNLADGTVEALFEGEDEKVKEILELCKIGPPLAKVKRIEVEKEKFKNEFQDFEILF
jgi:acylphosphatase